jgi:aminopeptidase S
MLKNKLPKLGLILLFASAVCGQNGETAKTAEAYAKAVNQITTGEASKGRGAAIREELERLEVKYSFEPFATQMRGGKEVKGWNIVAEIPNPKAAKTLLLGAHYDRVAKGRGAIDNASGSAAILQLLQAFKEKPLQNFSVKAAFWDLEEVGLLGSREFVKTRGENNLPAIYINFDVFGFGNTIWLWTRDETTGFAKSLTETAGQAKIKTLVGNKYPPSDHLSFLDTKVETYSFSLVKEDEIATILDMFEGKPVKPENIPSAIRIIHTDNDTADKIDAKAVATALAVIEQAIRNIDK